MIKELVKISNKLDLIGLTKEADELDQVIRKFAQTGGFVNPDSISEEETLAGDRHPLDAGKKSQFSGQSPEERMISLIDAVNIIKTLGDKSAEEIAAHYGFAGKKEMITMIDKLMKGIHSYS